MKEGFVFLQGGHGLSTLRRVDQWHTAEGIISVGWLMMASTHRCLSCLSRGCLGVRLTLTPLPLALTTCRHLRWAAFFSQRHQVSDMEEWTGKPLCLVLLSLRGHEKLLVETGSWWRFRRRLWAENKCKSNFILKDSHLNSFARNCLWLYFMHQHFKPISAAWWPIWNEKNCLKYLLRNLILWEIMGPIWRKMTALGVCSNSLNNA